MYNTSHLNCVNLSMLVELPVCWVMGGTDWLAAFRQGSGLKLIEAQQVNLWYFCVESKTWKDDDSNDEEDDDEEEASSSESEQEEKKVRSRRLPARR